MYVGTRLDIWEFLGRFFFNLQLRELFTRLQIAHIKLRKLFEIPTKRNLLQDFVACNLKIPAYFFSLIGQFFPAHYLAIQSAKL